MDNTLLNKVSKSPVKLNLGCGLQCPEGWVNIDSSMGVRLSKMPVLNKVFHTIIPSKWNILPNIKWPKNTVWMDITKKLPFGDDSVDCIYSSHTIEHLTYDEAEFIFNECFRVLKKGGIIRIIVPDFEVLVNSYLENRKTEPGLASKIFHSDSYYFEIPIPKNYMGLLKFSFKMKNNHYFLYDKEGLKYQLEKSGFSSISGKPYGESEIPEIKVIDNPDRFRNAICLEAIK